MLVVMKMKMMIKVNSFLQGSCICYWLNFATYFTFPHFKNLFSSGTDMKDNTGYHVFGNNCQKLVLFFREIVMSEHLYGIVIEHLPCSKVNVIFLLGRHCV